MMKTETSSPTEVDNEDAVVKRRLRRYARRPPSVSHRVGDFDEDIRLGRRKQVGSETNI